MDRDKDFNEALYCEHGKLKGKMNQFKRVTKVHVFPRQLRHFLTGMSNRVEHQKLNQEAAELPPG